MAVGDQNFTVRATFVDKASGKVIKANAAMINSMKKVGVQFQKTGAETAMALDKMAQGHEKAGRFSRFHNAQIGKLIGSIGSMRNIILVWMFALGPLINLFKSATKAMMIQEDAVKRLSFAMEIQGTASKFMQNNLKELSAAFQETTRYGDEAILEVMEKLITVGGVVPSKLKRATQAVVDFAAGSGRSLSEAGELIAKSAVGYTMQISRLFGVTIPKSMSVAKQFEMVLGLIEGKMAGRAQRDIKSYAGSVAQMANAWSDAKEALGFFLNKTFHLQAGMKIMKDMFDTWSGKNASTAMMVLDKEISKVDKSLQILIKTSKNISGKNFLFMKPDNLTNKIAEKQQERLALITRKTQLEIQSFMDSIRLKEQGKIIEAEQAKMATQKEWADTYSIFQRTRADYQIEQLNQEYALYLKVFEDNAARKLEIEEWYQAKVTKLRKLALTDAKDQYDAMEVMTKSFAVNMRNSMSDGFFKVIKGDFESLKDVLVSFGDAMLKTITDIIANLIIMSIWQKAAGLLGYSGGVVGAVINAGTARAHSGGYIMDSKNSFGYRKKFHSGGEVPATLLEGEGVLNRRAMGNLGVDNLNKLNRGEGSGGGGGVVNNYYIQTIDERSFRERLQQNGDIYANASGRSIMDNQSLRGITQKYG